MRNYESNDFSHAELHDGDFICDNDFTEKIAVDMVTPERVKQNPFFYASSASGGLVQVKNFPHHVYKDVEFGVGQVLECLPESERDFDVKKNFAVNFSETYQSLVSCEMDVKLLKRWLRRVSQVSDCGNMLIYQGNRLTNALFCKVRLCPLCSWRRAIKICMQTRQILESMLKMKQNFKFLFLTLTIPNVTDDELQSSLDYLLQSWRKMTHLTKNTRSGSVPDKFNQKVLGWYRGLEVTRNMDKYQVDYAYGQNGEKVKIPCVGEDGQPIPNPFYKTWHPHFHCILAVPADADISDLITIRNSKQQIIKQSCFLDWWKWATGDSSITQVDCREFRPSQKVLQNKQYQKKYSRSELQAMAIVSGVVEAAKYTVKTTDYYLDPEATKILDLALEQKKLVAYGGVMADIRKKLKLDDAVDGDLVLAGAAPVDEDVPRRCYAFSVGFGCYVRIYD